MSRCARKALLLAVLFQAVMLLGAEPAKAQDPVQGVNVSIDRDTIGLDEQVVLQIEVAGTSQNLPKPKLPPLPMFEVYSQGRSSNISIVNGQMTASVTYRYLLLPQKPGTFPIRRIAVVYNNKRYQGNPVTVTVLDKGAATHPELEQRARDDAGRNRDYFMEAVVNKSRPFINEQVTLTLKIYFGVQTFGSPELTEPVTTGFWTEILGNKPPYYQRINGRNYRVIERKYALFPTQTGKLTIGRAMIKATVAGRTRRRDPFDVFGMFGGGEEVRMRTRPVTVDVQPLPDKNRPKDFTGTIGRFTIQATANKIATEVNQPISVTFKIKGVGNIKSVAEPPIPTLDDFRVYRASSNENITKLADKIGGTKIFEEVFIPKKPGKLVIPSVRFTFFDPEKRQYRSVSTRPITLKVRKPEGYAVSPEVPYAGPDMTVGSGATDIRYIKETSGGWHRQGHLVLFSPLYVMANTLPVVIFAGLLLFRYRREKLTADVGYARSRAASRMARKRLARAKQQAVPSQSSAFYAELSSAVVSYVADKLDLSPHGLTSEMIEQLLRERGVEPDLVDTTVRFLRECDFARFAPSSISEANIREALRDAEDLLVRIEGAKIA